jgi:hypothetical protein
MGSQRWKSVNFDGLHAAELDGKKGEGSLLEATYTAEMKACPVPFIELKRKDKVADHPSRMFLSTMGNLNVKGGGLMKSKSKLSNSPGGLPPRSNILSNIASSAYSTSVHLSEHKLVTGNLVRRWLQMRLLKSIESDLGWTTEKRTNRSRYIASARRPLKKLRS